MSERLKFKVFQVCSILGCFLIILFQGLPWYWGNLSIYIASYYRAKHGIKMKVFSAWTPSIFLLFWALPSFLVHLPATKFGYRWTMLIGIILNELGLILGWLAMHYPDIPLELGFGGFCGLGTCFSNTVSLLVVIDWTNTHSGVVTSFIQGSFCATGLIINQIVSWYINPANKESLREADSVPYFPSQEVNDRVPQYLITFIIVSTNVSLLGLLLLRNRASLHDAQFDSDEFSSNDSETLCLKPKIEEGDAKIVKDKSLYTPSDLLRNQTFYFLVYCVIVTDIMCLTFVTYYKPFGRSQISDDHFLALAGSVSVIPIIICNILSGAAMDRYGVKRPLMFQFAGYCLVSTFIYFTPALGKWPYFFCVQLAMTATTTPYNALIYVLISLFGKYKFAYKMTMMFAISIVSTLVIPPILKSLILAFGWFGLFTLSSASSLSVMILACLCLPEYV